MNWNSPNLIIIDSLCFHFVLLFAICFFNLATISFDPQNEPKKREDRTGTIIINNWVIKSIDYLGATQVASDGILCKASYLLHLHHARCPKSNFHIGAVSSVRNHSTVTSRTSKEKSFISSRKVPHPAPLRRLLWENRCRFPFLLCAFCFSPVIAKLSMKHPPLALKEVPLNPWYLTWKGEAHEHRIRNSWI